MKRIMLIISYDGTNYCGWQKQNNGMAVEEIINKTIRQITGENTEIIGASRTDAGVHALGNVAVFDTQSQIPADRFAYALNRYLPEDIVIQKSLQVEDDFHPRYKKCVKTYEYSILNRRMPLPGERYYSYFFYGELDVNKMKEASDYMVGEHDFKSFCSAGAQVKSTIRTIYKIDVERVDDKIIIRVRGNGFLYNMVRIIAGTLIQVGTGKILPGDIYDIMNAHDRKMAGPTAPAKGLTLVNIDYDEC